MGWSVGKPGRPGRLLPRFSLSALLISLFSGLVLVFQYQPFGEVFADLETMTSQAPFGFFFRRLHYFSGQAFAVLALAHTADHFWRRSYRFFGLTGWLKLWLAACLALLLLFIPNIAILVRRGVKRHRITYNYFFTIVNIVATYFLLIKLIENRWFI